MKLNITQWGNSAALRLPAPLLAQLGVKVGDSFAADVAKDRLTLRVIKDERTIELSVVAGQDASLSLRIKDRALGDAGRIWVRGVFRITPMPQTFTRR